MAAASLRRYLLLCNHFPDLLTNALVALKFSLDPGWLSALFFFIKRPTWLLHLVWLLRGLDRRGCPIFLIGDAQKVDSSAALRMPLEAFQCLKTILLSFYSCNTC
jgi:hypothetical protein